jgi:CubicO group peptidase (beta-lactamase class C family)
MIAAAAALAGAQARPSSAVLSPADRTTIERTGAAWVAMLNDGRSADGLALFSASTRATVGDARLTEQIGRVRGLLGRLEFHHARLAEFPRGAQRSRVLHVFARASSDNRWRDFQLLIEPEPPFRFDQLAFIAEVAEPVYLPNADLPDPGTREWLDDYVDTLVEKEGLSGAVLVTHGGGTTFARAFGSADAAGTTPIALDTRFSMASASKMFTGAMIVKLVEDGRLRFTDTIDRYLPADIVEDAWRRVTIDQLLSHRSGIGEYWTQEYSATKPDLRTARDFLPWIRKAGQAFAPGAEYRYSNSNYILLGLVIEHVTGGTYDEALRRMLLQPLGLSSTSLGNDAASGRGAEPLARDGQGWRHSGLRGRGSPAGGAWTTVADATAFLRAMASGRVVSRESLRAMTTPKNPGADGYPYGYALEMRSDGGASSWGHGGIASGVNAELRYFPALDATLVVFSNQDNGAFDDLKKNLIRLITGAR